MNIKMILFDLDGTLLHTDKTLSQYSVSVINRCREKGIKLVIATSRSVFSAKKYIETLKPDAVISSGGAISSTDKEIISKAMIPANIANDIISLCLNNPSVGYVRFMGEKHSIANNPALRPPNKNNSQYTYDDMSMPVYEDAYKLTIQCDSAEFINSIAELHNICNLEVFRDKKLCKITHINATKEDAMKIVANYYNIDLAETMSFGDDISDLKMLQASGVGVAVENSMEELKKIADYVCGCNDNDGVTVFLEKMILNPDSCDG